MSVSLLAPVSRTDAPVTSRTVGALSLPVDEFRAAIAAGHRVVDIRSQAQRDAAGVVSGALAIDATHVLDRLVPGTAHALRSATTDARWILVSADGHDAEWLVWHLQARGVVGARFLLGGVGALVGGVRRDGRGLPLSQQCLRDLATIAAH